MGLLSKPLANAAKWSSQHPYWVVGLALLVVGFGLAGASRLQVDLRASQLLPQNLPSLESYRKQVKEFGRAEFLIVMIEPPEGLPLRRYRRFIASYKKALHNLHMAKAEHLNLSEELLERVSDYVIRHGMFLLSDDQLKKVSEHLNPEFMKERLAAHARKPSATIKGERFDPLGLVKIAEQYYLPSDNIQPDASGEYYVTRDQKIAFFIFGSTAAAGKTDKTSKLLLKAERLAEDIWKAYTPRSGGESAAAFPLPRITWTGLPAILLEDLTTLKQSARTSIWMSFCGVILLFLLFFRGLKSVWLAFIPVCVGLCATFGLAGVTIGTLNIATAGVGAILIGLSIDFPAYLLNGYWRRRHSGKDHAAAVQETWSEEGRSVCLGAITTCAAFLMLIFTSLAAFRELGLIAGTGLFFALVSVLFLVPALLSLSRSTRLGRTRAFPRILFVGQGPHAKWVLIVCLALFIGFGTQLKNLKLDMNLSETHADGTGAQRAFSRLTTALDNPLLPFRIIVSGGNWNDVLRRTESIALLAEEYELDGKVTHFDSLVHWVPSAEKRRRTQAWLETRPELNPGQFQENYRRALPDPRLLEMSSYRGYMKGVSRALSSRQPPYMRALKQEGLGILLDRYSKQDDYRIQLVNYLYPTTLMSEGSKRMQLLDELISEPLLKEKWVHVLSEDLILKEMKALIRSELFWIATAMLGMIFVVIWTSFRSFQWACVAIIPMMMGLGAMLGSYTLLREYLSGANLLFIPLFVGLAIDDAIHLINHIRKPRGTVRQALQNAGMPILFTSLTTMIGFGTLALSPFPIMQQAGILVALAMGWELIASLLFLPALVSLWRNH